MLKNLAKYLIIFSIFFLGFVEDSFAQKVTIDQIIKQNDVGEIIGCGVDISLTNGDVSGLHVQSILFSRGNLNWDLDIHVVAGKLENRQFVQERVNNASITINDYEPLDIIKDNKYVLKTLIEDRTPDFIIPSMLENGFTVNYSTDFESDLSISVAASEEALRGYNQGCKDELFGMQREHYREIHGDTKCIDNPKECSAEAQEEKPADPDLSESSETPPDQPSPVPSN